MARKKIILVEDEKDMAELVAMRLAREGYSVQVANDGREGLDRINSDPPDLAILDIMLPKVDGLEIVQHIRNDPRLAGIPVLMLTAKSEESDVVVGLKIGADDYVTKPFSMSVLLARVAALLRRSTEPVDSDKVIQAGPITIDPHKHTVAVGKEKVTLTLTEFKLLYTLIAAKGRVLSRNQLMDQAIGVDAIVTDRTIDVHLTALRHKLGEARNLIQTIRGVGYKFDIEYVEQKAAAKSRR